MQPDHLIDLAEKMVGGAGSRPRQADLKRAKSTLYYALFHETCSNCANRLAGANNQKAWHQIYRSIDHGQVKKQFQKKNIMEKFPEEIRIFAQKFVDFQKGRHDADYDPASRYSRKDILDDIEDVRFAIGKLRAAPSADKKAFAVWASFKQRQS